MVCLPFSLEDVLAVGREIDVLESPILFGVTDSPMIFDETYLVQQALLAQTSHIRVGPFCTNPQTRHWSIHCGAHRTLRNIYGPRTFIGLAAGDSAVHSVGAHPASGEKLGRYFRALREHAPEGLRIQMAAGGLKTAAWAGRVADEIVIGQGIDRVATQQLTKSATEARRQQGIDSPFRRWLYVVVHMWDPDVGENPEEHEKFRAILMSYSRQALATTHDGKNVPEHMSLRLREIHSKYSFEHYGQGENARLMKAFPEEEEFITRRYGFSGTPAEIAAQMHAAVADTGVDGIWVNLVTRASQPLARKLVEEWSRGPGH